MTRILLDTNVVLRLVETMDPGHQLSRAAIRACITSGRTPCLAPQVFVEFWVVATRPRTVNGFGWEPQAARTAIDGLASRFPVLPEDSATFPLWLDRVTAALVRGKRAHDVRLAAMAIAHGVTAILTLNPVDYSGIAGITAVHPSEIV